MNLKKYSQFELFPGAAPAPVQKSGLSELFKDLTLSLEHIIVLAIVFIMMMVVTFSMGVEKGKKVVPKSPGALSQVKEVGTIPHPNRVLTSQPQRQQLPRNSAGNMVKEEIPVPGVRPGAMPNEQINLEKNRQILEIPLEKKKLFEELYTIQVASFKSQKSADQEAKNLRSKGFDIFVLPKGEHLIVCVGKFQQKDVAQKFLSKLKNKYNDSLVRRF